MDAVPLKTHRFRELQSMFRRRVAHRTVSSRRVQAADEWVRLKDDASGEAYYFNKLTGACQWDEPVRAVCASCSARRVHRAWRQSLAVDMNYLGSMSAPLTHVSADTW